MFDVIKHASSESWVGLAGVLFGAFLTTFSVWLTNRANFRNLKEQLRHSEKLNDNKQRKERLEELYILIGHWNNLFFSHYINLTLVMRGQIDYNQYLDMINDPEKKGVDFNRIEMIIDIYGGEFSQAFDKVIKVREKINAINASHKRAYLNGSSGEDFLDIASDAQLDLGKACDSLKLQIAEAARTA